MPGLRGIYQIYAPQKIWKSQDVTVAEKTSPPERLGWIWLDVGLQYVFCTQRSWKLLEVRPL